MLVPQHSCNVVFTGASVALDLRSAAYPGADRWLSMVTSTIDETVTLLRERFFSPYRATARGRATFGHTGDSTGGRASFDRGDSTAAVFCFQHVLEDIFLNWEEGCGSPAKAQAKAWVDVAHNPPDDRDVRMRSVLEHHDNKARVRALQHHGTPCL